MDYADPMLLDRAWSNCLAHMLYKAKNSGQIVRQTPTCLQLLGTSPAGPFTVTEVRFGDDSFEQDFHQSLRPYREAGIGADWLLGPDTTPTDAGKRLRKLHLMGPRYLPVMVFDLDRLDSALRFPDIRLVDDWSQFESQPLPLDFWSAKAQLQDARRIQREVEAADPERLWTAFAWRDGVPVAMASVFHDEEWVGIYNVVTSKSHRGQGIGTQLMLHALNVARDRGAQVATLQTGPGGDKFYERIGFVKIGQLTSLYYSKERSMADAARLGSTS
jgi:GNAT superfamily N-acetyltransferase